MSVDAKAVEAINPFLPPLILIVAILLIVGLIFVFAIRGERRQCGQSCKFCTKCGRLRTEKKCDECGGEKFAHMTYAEAEDTQFRHNMRKIVNAERL